MKIPAVTKDEFYIIIFLFFFISTMLFDVWIYKTTLILAIIHGIVGGGLAVGITLIYHLKIKK